LFEARAEVKCSVVEKRERKGKPHKLSALIPEAARALGFEEELELSRRAHVFHELLMRIAPHLAPHCRLSGGEGARLIIEVDDRATAQELHLRSAEIASAYSSDPSGMRAIGLTVRLGRGGDDTERH
jgi:hypothetical protein